MPPNPRRTAPASRPRVPLRREDATLEDDDEPPSPDSFSQPSRETSASTSQNSRVSLEMPRDLPGCGARERFSGVGVGVGLGIRNVG